MKKRTQVLCTLGLVMSLSAIGCGKGGSSVSRDKNGAAVKASCLDSEKVAERLRALPRDQGIARELSFQVDGAASPAYLDSLAREFTGDGGFSARWSKQKAILIPVRQDACKRVVGLDGEAEAISGSTPTSLTIRGLSLELFGVQQLVIGTDNAVVDKAGMLTAELSMGEVGFTWCGGKVKETHAVTLKLGVMLDGSTVPDDQVDPAMVQLLTEVQAREGKILWPECPSPQGAK